VFSRGARGWLSLRYSGKAVVQIVLIREPPPTLSSRLCEMNVFRKRLSISVWGRRRSSSLSRSSPDDGGSALKSEMRGQTGLFMKSSRLEQFPAPSRPDQSRDQGPSFSEEASRIPQNKSSHLTMIQKLSEQKIIPVDSICSHD
jgi:hypothetical protein